MDHIPDPREMIVLLWFPAVGMETLISQCGERKIPSHLR